ncbi:hypothetical protein VTL71DRAFT_7840 [Oculimacula yallundae]|uniref:Uncharacterized protein n=1 Tax=Oculimacula yallundae TaxID=86028 RepID=A0ABR4CW41_9HELO
MYFSVQCIASYPSTHSPNSITWFFIPGISTEEIKYPPNPFPNINSSSPSLKTNLKYMCAKTSKQVLVKFMSSEMRKLFAAGASAASPAVACS